MFKSRSSHIVGTKVFFTGFIIQRAVGWIKTKLICYNNTKLIPPLSIDLLAQERHALSRVANKPKVISSWMAWQSCVMKMHCIELFITLRGITVENSTWRGSFQTYITQLNNPNNGAFSERWQTQRTMELEVQSHHRMMIIVLISTEICCLEFKLLF